MAFINANSKDFWEQGIKQNQLHTDLKADLDERKIENSFLIYPSLRNFAEVHMTKPIADFDEDDFQEKHQDYIENVTEKAAMAFLRKLDLAAVRAKLIQAGFAARPTQAINQVRWKLFEGIDRYKFLSFAKVGDNQIYVSFKFDLRMIELYVDMLAPDYFAYQADFEHEYINQDINNHYAHMNTLLIGDFHAAILFDTKVGVVDQISIDLIRLEMKL